MFKNMFTQKRKRVNLKMILAIKHIIIKQIEDNISKRNRLYITTIYNNNMQVGIMNAKLPVFIFSKSLQIDIYFSKLFPLYFGYSPFVFVFSETAPIL